HHDARDPDARADFFEDDVARHFEQEVTPEEGTGRHAVSCGIEAEILVHGERCETDIDAIEIAKEINQNGQRQEPPIDLAHGRSFDAHGCLPWNAVAGGCLLLFGYSIGSLRAQATDGTRHGTPKPPSS